MNFPFFYGIFMLLGLASLIGRLRTCIYKKKILIILKKISLSFTDCCDQFHLTSKKAKTFCWENRLVLSL